MEPARMYSREFLWDTIKRLIALGALNAWVAHEDGHRWINTDEDEYRSRTRLSYLIGGAEKIRSKVYGGVLEALDRVDLALEKNGERTLSQLYDELELQFGPALDEQ